MPILCHSHLVLINLMATSTVQQRSWSWQLKMFLSEDLINLKDSVCFRSTSILRQSPLHCLTGSLRRPSSSDNTVPSHLVWHYLPSPNPAISKHQRNANHVFSAFIHPHCSQGMFQQIKKTAIILRKPIFSMRLHAIELQKYHDWSAKEDKYWILSIFS